MANKPNNPALWSRAKSMAKQKFDVYPSAYANGWAAKYYKSKGGTWRKAEYGMEVMGDGGTPDNPGFNALPPAVQQKIIDNMADGGEKMPPEIAHARFAAAGNLDKMADYGYAYGGYIPEMMYGGNEYMQQGGQKDKIMQLIQAYAQMNKIDPKQLIKQLQGMPVEQQQQAIQQMAQSLQQSSQQPDMTQAAMAYGGYTTGIFAEGGEPNGGMALGQMSAVVDKMSKLRQFVSPEQNLDPWIASKLAVMDDSADAISDYMMYNPEAQEGEEEEENGQEEMPEMGNGGYTVTRSNDRKGKTHKVTGPDGTVKYFGDAKLGQHPKDPERKAAFYARHKKNLDRNPYFRAFARATWKDGGSTFSGNAFYQTGGEQQLEDYPDYGAWRADVLKYNFDQANPQVQQASMQEEPKVMWHPEWEDQGIDPMTQSPASKKAAAPINYGGVSIVDLLSSAGKASDYNSRKQLAAQLGIDNYYGSAKQNLELIKKVTSNPDVLSDYKPVGSPKSKGTKSSVKIASIPASPTLMAPDYLRAPVQNSYDFLNSKVGFNDIPAASGSASKPSTKNEERKRAREIAKGNENYEFTFPDGTRKAFKDMDWREQFYVAGRDLGNLSYDNWTDYINPLAMIGTMAEDLGTSAYEAKKSNSVMPYVKGISQPLLAGALSKLIPTTKIYPGYLGLPAAQTTKAAQKLLPQGAKRLTQGNPTNWVTNSGLSFKQGGINLDPAKKGTFKAQATRMGMGVQEAASAILNAPEGKYSPAMRKKANFAKNFAKQAGGPVEGEVLDVSPEQLEVLRQQGYQFEIM